MFGCDSYNPSSAIGLPCQYSIPQEKLKQAIRVKAEYKFKGCTKTGEPVTCCSLALRIPRRPCCLCLTCFIKLHQRRVSCQHTASQLNPTTPPLQDTQLREMEFGTSGMLNEGNSDLVRALFGTQQLIKAF
jgi:hypothetical protein